MNPPRPSAAAVVRVLPPALLLILVMAGLRGAIGSPRFNGPDRQYGMAIGAALAAVLAVLLVVTIVRHHRARPADGYGELDGPAKLRAVLLVVLSAGIAADIVAIIVGLHLKLFRLTPRHRPNPLAGQGTGTPSPSPTARGSNSGAAVSQVVLYLLLAIVVLVAIVAIARFARMLQRPAPALDDGEIAEDTEQTLRDAVEHGRRALRTFDDTRAAIIACYAAMEDQLALHGAARTVADTPDELLARATKAGIVHGPAARTLTRLFYEARFSTHPMGQTQRAGAELCLDELAMSLAEAHV